MTILYTAEAKAIGGRDGSVSTSDGHLTASLSLPKAMGGPGGAGTNPEQLFAAGYAACFLSALRFIAGPAGAKIPPEASVTAQVGIGPQGAGFGLDVALIVDLPGLERGAAEALIARAHEVCPYSNATRGNIPVRLSLA